MIQLHRIDPFLPSFILYIQCLVENNVLSGVGSARLGHIHLKLCNNSSSNICLNLKLDFLGILGHRQIREKTFQKLPRIDEGRPSAPERIVFIHRQLTVNCYDKCPPDDE